MIKEGNPCKGVTLCCTLNLKKSKRQRLPEFFALFPIWVDYSSMVKSKEYKWKGLNYQNLLAVKVQYRHYSNHDNVRPAY
jgi:hypothetical protein